MFCLLNYIVPKFTKVKYGDFDYFNYLNGASSRNIVPGSVSFLVFGLDLDDGILGSRLCVFIKIPREVFHSWNFIVSKL